MKKLIALLLLAVCQLSAGYALSARQVLDKCAQTLNAPEGLQADFSMTSAQYGSASGTIAIKGRKFHASTPMASMWFDGTTQWTYMKKNDEVSVTTPTETQLQAFNPYNFINIYKKGYKQTMTTSATAYTVHLTAEKQGARLKELFITVDKKSYQPSEVKLLQGTKWTTFTISNLRKVSLADAAFRFNSKDFPTAEVIDLR